MSDPFAEPDPVEDSEQTRLISGNGAANAVSSDGTSVQKGHSYDILEDASIHSDDMVEADPAGAVELTEVIERIGNGSYQNSIGVMTGIAELADGMQQLAVSFLIHHLGHEFHLSNQAKSLVGSVSGAGMLLGATAFGRLSDIYGRRMAFITTLLMSGIFGLLSASVNNYYAFLGFRFFQAIGIGGNVPLAFSYFAEFAAQENRGGYLTLLEAFWSVGAIFTCLLAWQLLPTAGWHVFVVSTVLPALLLGLFSIWNMPESPRFQLVSGDVEAARATLRDMAAINGLQDYDDPMVKPSEASFEESGFMRLFDPGIRKNTLLVMSLYFLLAFGCGVFVWMPVLLEMKHIPLMSMYRSMVIMACSQVPGVVLASYMVERVGRREAIATFFFLGAVFCAIFALVEGTVVVITITVIMEFFLAGANGALAAITVETFPTTLRSSAMGACSSLSRASYIMNPLIWSYLLDISAAVAIMSSSAALVMGFVIIWFLPETKGTMLRDHQKRD